MDWPAMRGSRSDSVKSVEDTQLYDGKRNADHQKVDGRSICSRSHTLLQ